MSLPFMILLIGLLYALLVGGLALFRREGISTRFMLESAVITLLFSGVVWMTGFSLSPVIFLIVLYLLTMRVRLLVDLANVFARLGRGRAAAWLYQLASRLWPDSASLLILKVNQATLLLEENFLEQAISLFVNVLEQAEQGALGAKYEAAAHYNLGVAYLRNNQESSAAIEFNATIDTWPLSLYAKRAEQALEKRRQKTSTAAPTENS